MHPITMPPTTLLDPTKDCLVFPDPLQIKFNDDGFFGSSKSGLFTPGLPMGYFTTGTSLGPFTPLVDNTTVDLVFIDTNKTRVFVINLAIQDKCP
jgi:hypothetical protein